MLNYRSARSADMQACIALRALTSDNPMSADYLHSIAVNTANWCPLIDAGTFKGSVCEDKGKLVGFCFAEIASGEILVLAVLAEYEGKGIGTRLLSDLVTTLRQSACKVLWLAASPEPNIRAHGFYRHLGWTDSGKLDANGDQILTLAKLA